MLIKHRTSIGSTSRVCSVVVFCETSTSFVFTELANTMKYGEGSYITLFSSSDVTAFHRMKYGGGGVVKPYFHCV